MKPSQVLLLLLLAAAVLPATASDVLTLDDSVYFQWRPVPSINKKTVVHVCGFGIFGNHISRKNPKPEWDVNIDELVQGDTRVVGVTAGTFDVNGRKRTPRSAITGLEFSWEGAQEPVAIQIVGAPNRDNGIRAVIDLPRSAALFSALETDQYITLSFRYADGTTDAVRLRGYRDPDRGTKMSTFARCLRGDPPATTGPLFPVY